MNTAPYRGTAHAPAFVSQLRWRPAACLASVGAAWRSGQAVGGWVRGVSSSPGASYVAVCLAISCQPAISASIAALATPRACHRDRLSWGGDSCHLVQRNKNASADANTQIIPCCWPRGRRGPLLFADRRSSLGDKCGRLCVAVVVFVLIVVSSSALVPACFPGTFKPKLGDGSCASCPANSHSGARGASICPCQSGFHRADSDPPESVCTSK